MQRLFALIKSNRCRIAVLLSTSLLGSCGVTDRQDSTLLQVAQASNENEQQSASRFHSERKISKDFQQQLKEMQPAIKLHPSIYAAETLEQELRVRTNSGLGPDLVITDSNQALTLLAEGITTPIQLTEEKRVLISPSALERVKTANGTLAGQPVSQYLQLACFDKRKLKEPPKTLTELSAASGRGKVFGMVTNLQDLYWSLGSFGAGEALATSLAGKQATDAAHERLTQWMRWLKASSYQQNIVFLRNQASLRKALIGGEMSWISCWSSQLPQLREALKDHLGIAPLPSGDFGRATPITRLQVWALGKNSSKRQRAESLRLLNFMVQPWAQKTFALKYKTGYPVNPAAALIVRKQLSVGFNKFNEEENERVSRGDAIISAIDARPKLEKDIQSTLNELIFDGLSPEQAATELQTQIKAKP
ncbi:ABC transporter substrate-binding protein [Synechococcus sp. MU1655]|uniref:extracellular solute-binding protein n=1 Tax=Synechococcus sp. MU1655 TaxID=2508355 RepID=UPI0020273A57